MKTLKRPPAGFLLVEALMAVTVLLVGLLGVYGGFQKSMESLRNSAEHFDAALLMEQALWTLENTGSPEPPDGATDLPDARWEIAPRDPVSPRWKEWDVTFSWTGPRQRARALTLPAMKREP